LYRQRHLFDPSLIAQVSDRADEIADMDLAGIKGDGSPLRGKIDLCVDHTAQLGETLFDLGHTTGAADAFDGEIQPFPRACGDVLAGFNFRAFLNHCNLLILCYIFFRILFEFLLAASGAEDVRLSLIFRSSRCRLFIDVHAANEIFSHGYFSL